MADYISQIKLPNNTTYDLKDAAALPKAGGTMTGNITMPGTGWIYWPDSGNWGKSNSGVTFPVVRGGIQWTGQSDWIKLFSEETSSDNLKLVLQFGDDASPGLSIRNSSGTEKAFIKNDGTITAVSYTGSGASLTSLNASNISSGTLSADRLATSGATAGSYGPSAAVSGSNGTTMNVPYITVDNKGRVTAISNKVYTAVNTWRGIQDNLTSSTNTTESLSAKQGYLLANGSARDDTKLPLAGGLMTGTIRRVYSANSDNPIINLISDNKTVYLWKIGSGSADNSNYQSYGFALQYYGEGAGQANYLRLKADNQNQSTKYTAIGIDQSGHIGIGTDADTTYQLYINGSTKINLGTNDTTNLKNFLIIGNNRSLSIGGSGIMAYSGTNTGTLSLQYYGGTLNVGNSSNTVTTTIYGSLTLPTNGTAFNFSGITNGTSDSARNIWFSYNNQRGTPVYNDNFKYNPATTTMTIGTGTLSATNYSGTAAKATADASGNTITATYATKTEVNGLLAAADAMIFKGTLGTGGTITAVPDGTTGKEYQAGYTYKVITAGTYAGIVCEIGDLLIAIADSTSGQTKVNNAHWTVAQTNIDGAITGPASVTATGNIAIFDGTTGKIIKDSGTTIANATVAKADAANLTTTTNAMAYYSDATGTFASGTNVKYLNSVGVKRSGSDTIIAYQDGLQINCTSYGNAANNLANTNGSVQYGDGGGQIQFITSQPGAMIYSHHDNTSGMGAAFHFVSNTGSTAVKASGLIATTRAVIGEASVDGNYTLKVNGTSYFSETITMAGQIKTSFQSSIAIGSYASNQSTIANLINEVRYSSGCMGSVSITTAYTLNNVTIPTGWYNFEYVPHRSGGVNGQASGDNCNYGVLYLHRMNGGEYQDYTISFDSAAIKKVYLTSGFKSSITSGEVIVSDGTLGAIKTSGYTIATSVPENAVFTDHYDWGDITNKPISFISGAYGTTGWKQLGGRTNSQSSIVVFKPTDNTAVTWGTISHSAVIAWGNGDTKGMIDCSYNTPLVSIAGGNAGGSTDAAPKWYFKFSATSGKTYTLPTDSKTLCAADGSNASGTDWGISITGSSANVTGTIGIDHGGTGLASANPHEVLIGPVSGSNAAAPTWRKLRGEDLHYYTGNQTNQVTSSPYQSALWYFNASRSATSFTTGDIVLIKTPGGGGSQGVFISLDNGTSYRPLCVSGTARCTTHFTSGVILALVYDSAGQANGIYGTVNANGTLSTTTGSNNVSGGCWRVMNLYDSGNSNDTGTLIRDYGGNVAIVTTTAALYRYQLMLSITDTNYGWKAVPINTTSNTQGTGKTTIYTGEFNPFGEIYYYSHTDTVNANNTVRADRIWKTYPVNIKYSFNCGDTLTASKDVYIVATMQSATTAKLRNPTATGDNAKATATGANAGPITQTLPTTNDGFIYIRLGRAYNSNTVDISIDHPIYYHDGTNIRRLSPINTIGTTKGDMMYWSAGNIPKRLAIGTAGYFLKSTTDGPAWEQKLPIANGGTGATDAAGARTNLGLGSIATYGAATAGTKDTWGLVPVIGASDGVMEIGKYIDFHTTDGNTKDYDVRITAATTGLTISGTTSGTFSGSLTGNASTATTLQTERKIWGRTFNGSADVTGDLDWDSDTYRQRIKVSDNSTANDDVFTFSQSTDSGSNYTTLLSIQDDGCVWAGSYAKNTAQTYEHDLGVRGGAGKIYFWSGAAVNGNRGIYLRNANESTSSTLMTVNQSNQITGFATIACKVNISYANTAVSTPMMQLTDNAAASVAASSKWMWGISHVVSNLAAGGNTCFITGKANGTNNSAVFSFHYADNNSDNNYADVSLYGNNGLFKVYKTGKVEITKNITSSSTTTGSLVVAGGTGIAGALYVGTGAYISGTSATFATDIFKISNSSDVTWTPTGSFLAPNLTTTHYNAIQIGKKNEDKNVGHLSFYYAGDKSTSNRFALGFYNVTDILVVRADRKVGINTTAPSHDLSINGDTSSKKFIVTDTETTPADKVTLQWNATDQSLDFIFA